MDIDPQLAQLAPQVLKLIKKLEVELLCPQHNPVRIHSLFMSEY